MERIHFIAGLPRSGSTLLSALLNQNPRFSADVTSPLFSLFGAIIPQMNARSDFRSFFDYNLRRDMLHSIVHTYYNSKPYADVVFDTHRGWPNYLDLLSALYPSCRLVCCVRAVPAIIESFERGLNKNPLRTSGMFGYKHGTSIYWRIKDLMNPDSGSIGAAYDALRGAWYGDNSSMLIAVDYDTLVREPQVVLDRLYEELGEPQCEHNFTNIEFDRPQFDNDLGIPDLHKVRPRVEIISRASVLPLDIVEAYNGFSFWNNENQGSSRAVRLFQAP